WTNHSTASIYGRHAKSLSGCVQRPGRAARFFCAFISSRMPSASAIASSSCPTGAFAAPARSMSFARRPAFLTLTWRTSFLRSHDADKPATAPFTPLVVKEIREVAGGRALWIMLLLICPLVGYSFFQAGSLYGDSSLAAQQSPALAVSLSPLDGILVPT